MTLDQRTEWSVLVRDVPVSLYDHSWVAPPGMQMPECR